MSKNKAVINAETSAVLQQAEAAANDQTTQDDPIYQAAADGIIGS